MDEPAFPNQSTDTYKAIWNGGLTKREWFAGQALAGLCANPTVFDGAGKMACLENLDDAASAGIFGQMAVEMADAALAGLAKDNP